MNAPRNDDDAARTAVQRPLVRWLARFGAPGVMLAAALLWLESWLPLAALKSKTVPLALLGCAGVSWLSGGQVGLLIAAQLLVHALAHVHAAQRLGLMPGWRSFIPFVGVYAGTTPQSFGSREAEAEVALAGVLAGLITATAFYAYGAFAGIAALLMAAKFGFLFNLINLLPFRPFDGGRIFPGSLWRYAGDGDCAPEAGGQGAGQGQWEGDLASRRFIAGCRGLVERLSRASGRVKDNRAVLAEALNAVLFGAAGVVALACIFLPPLAFVISILLGMAAVAWFIAAMVALDPRAVSAKSERELQSRWPVRGAAAVAGPLPWRDARASRAALAIYAVSVAALSYGAWVV